jgi:hypothetical protein
VRLLTYSPLVRLRSRQLPYLSPRLTEPWPPRLEVSSGHARGASIPLHWFKKLASVFCRGPEEAQYRRERRFALSAPGIWHPRSMIRGPGPPCHRLGLLFLAAEMKRRATAGSGSLFECVRRFAFSALGDLHSRCMTCGPGPPCQRLGHLGVRSASDGISCSVSGREWESALKRDSPRVHQLRFRILSQSPHPFAFKLSAPLCIRALLLYTRAAAAAMTSLGHPERFQSEGALNLVRHLLGWSTPVHAGRIHTSAIPLDNLTAGEFVLFVSYLSCGLALPISPFFLLLLEELGLQLQ